jgi:hypothetical protein
LIDGGAPTQFQAPAAPDPRDRLRLCFQQLRAVIAMRIQDPVRRATLEKEIAVFDPDAWPIEGDPAAAVAEYEQKAGAFVRKIAGRRRRRRRGARRRRRPPASGSTDAGDRTD